MTQVEERLSSLFDELVPMEGKAATVAGEIVRAINRLAYRNYNDGDHVGVGYGRETCNPAARYLAEKCGRPALEALDSIWGVIDDDLYDRGLARLEAAVLDFLDANPGLRELRNEEDMWDYCDAEEDVDRDDDEGDYDEYEEDWEW